MTIYEIYAGAERLINSLVRKELIDKGHYLTGAAGEKLDTKVVKEAKEDVLQGLAVQYMQYVEGGFPAKSASMKQFYFVKQYFLQRGLEDKEAGGAAAATIHKWMKEGMSTKASARFSKDGTRNHVVIDAFKYNSDEINGMMFRGFDAAIDEEYLKEKSETI